MASYYPYGITSLVRFLVLAPFWQAHMRCYCSFSRARWQGPYNLLVSCLHYSESKIHYDVCKKFQSATNYYETVRKQLNQCFLSITLLAPYPTVIGYSIYELRNAVMCKLAIASANVGSCHCKYECAFEWFSVTYTALSDLGAKCARGGLIVPCSGTVQLQP